MEELIGKSNRIVARQSLSFKRALYRTPDLSGQALSGFFSNLFSD